MALVICDECNREFSDTLEACPHCGKKYQKTEVIEEKVENDSIEKEETVKGEEIDKKQITITLPSKNKVSSKTIGAVVAIVVIIMILFVSGGIGSSGEKLAVKNCEELISMLKDPDSFKLYGDVEILRVYDTETKEKEYEFMYVYYGAANSYGGMVRSAASFDGTGYLGDISEELEREDFSSDNKFQSYLMSKFERSAYILLGDGEYSYYELEVIPQEKVEKKLGID